MTLIQTEMKLSQGMLHVINVEWAYSNEENDSATCTVVVGDKTSA